MFNRFKKYLFIATAQFSIVFSMSVFAATADVLELDEISNTDVDTLIEDTKTFDTIGMGIALSIAQCDGKSICDPSVDENEIGQLIEALGRRIEGVESRQQNNGEELANIITAYADTKEKYNDYMDRLSKITRSAVPELSQDEFVEEDIFADEEALIEDDFSAFDDSDEGLEDDEDLEEFEDDVDSEEL